MKYIVAVVVGLVFGGADQYLGSRSSLGVWASSVSVMSAPWLILPFVFGWTQVRPRRAMYLGLVATAAALIGYFAMTLSPLENVALSRFPGDLIDLLRGGQLTYVLAGFVTGPLFGMLGQRWRVGRSWLSAVLVAGALCLEPLARIAVGTLPPPGLVWGAEVAIGAGAAVWFALAAVARRRALDHSYG